MLSKWKEKRKEEGTFFKIPSSGAPGGNFLLQAHYLQPWQSHIKVRNNLSAVHFPPSMHERSRYVLVSHEKSGIEYIPNCCLLGLFWKWSEGFPLCWVIYTIHPNFYCISTCFVHLEAFESWLSFFFFFNQKNEKSSTLPVGYWGRNRSTNLMLSKIKELKSGQVYKILLIFLM